MIREFLQQTIYTRGDWSIMAGEVVTLIIFLIIWLLVYRLSRARWSQRFYEAYKIDEAGKTTFEGYLTQLWLALGLFFVIEILSMNFVFYTSEAGDLNLQINHIVIAITILVIARIIDWVISNIIIHQYNEERKGIPPESTIKRREEETSTESIATKTVQYIVYILSAILIIRNFGLDVQLLPKGVGNASNIDLSISRILIAILIIMIARIISWLLTQIFLYGIYRRNKIDRGTQFAINQILKYVIYLIAILIALHSVGIGMTLLLGGAAALLVGIGLGLQQTFNDLFSGLVLLFERSVSVGDVLDVNGTVGSVKKIGLRASVLQTRPNVAVIIPNSKLVNDNVFNWTHYTTQARFDVGVRVAYGSDTNLVKRLLLRAVAEHPLILEYPAPFVRFNEFADSSLNFNIYFFTTRFLIIEDIKSDIRFKIDRYFREHNINIPFPQRDLWIKTPDNSKKPAKESDELS